MGTGRKRTISMFYGSLSEDSLQRIRNIETGFRNFPAYASYSIRNYCIDFRAGVQALEITKNGQPINLFLFYPDSRGKIGSIAVYGVNLQGHYNAMRNSMMAFGMPISQINMESGLSDYLDIYLDY